MTNRYGEAVYAAVESDGVQTTQAIKNELGIGYNDAARYTERMVADGIISECDKVGRRRLLRNFMGCCEPCGAPLFEDDEFATDENGCTACVPAFYEDRPGNYPCYADRVGALGAASGIETRSATTAGRGPQDESPTAAPSGGDAQPQPKSSPTTRTA